MTVPSPRRLLAAATLAACCCLAVFAASAASAAPLDLENLTGVEAEKLMQEGKLTSYQLVKAYEARIQALNKAGPALNAVTQINPNAIAEAKLMDKERAKHHNLGPAMGVPILLKDIIDATPMYTSAGDWALRESFPEKDSGVARNLRAHGVVILGKAGLSEWANSFGSQPSGFSNLTGQVLNANDAIAGPSGSSSGSGAAESAGLATLTIGTETGGSIISPSTAEEIVGLKPTLGLVPGFGIAPIDVSRDTAGPMEKTVADVAITLQSLAEVPGSDKEANEEFEGMEGPHFLENQDVLPAPFTTVPDYSSALSMEFVKGKRIGFNGTTCSPTPCTPTPTQEATAKAVKALEEAGAIMVPDATVTAEKTRSLPSGYEAHATIDEYYAHLGLKAPVKSLVQEVEVDATNPQEALKDGNSTHAKEAEAEDTPGGKNQKEFEEILPEQKKATQAAIEKMMSEPSGGGGPVIAVVGSVPAAPQAGMPLMVVPGGYTATQRRPIGVGIAGGAYDEVNMIGVGYVIEQSTKLRQSPAMIDPAMYRCAHTEPAEPFASRGHCNPDAKSIKHEFAAVERTLPFPLEATSVASLEELMNSGQITSKKLVKAELYRIGLTNADGPAIQAVRDINPAAAEEADASDRKRSAMKKAGTLGPLAGIPVLVNDSIDAAGLPTSGGSIALQDDMPASDSTIVAKLKAAGAIVLGDTNTGELGGFFDPNMPQGYSSLGGQVLLPSDTNKSIGGSSAGSAAAVAVGYAPIAIGSETSTEAAQMIAPAGNAGVVALKPTVGLIGRTGTMPVASSQDSPGPIGQSISDVATALEALAGPDPGDPATAGQPNPLPSYTAGLSPSALSGKKIAVVASTTVPYPAAVTELEALGAKPTTVTPGAAAKAPSVIPYEFHRDLDSFLASTGGPKSLKAVTEYNSENPVEGLKFGQNSLLGALAVEYNEPTTKSTYEANLAAGKEESKAVIDSVLDNGTPSEPADDYSAMMVPSGSPLVGIADRAGYPVLTVPAGFAAQNSSTGGDPIGVDFIAGSYSEAELLADGYAFEQGMKARQTGPAYMQSAANPGFSGVPSETNQSMWRCVLGSSFFKPYECNAGEEGSPLLGPM